MDEVLYYKKLLDVLQEFENDVLRSFKKVNENDPFVPSILGTLLIFDVLISEQDEEGMKEITRFMLNFIQKRKEKIQDLSLPIH